MSSYLVVVEATADRPGVVSVVGTLPPVMTEEDVMSLGMAVVDVANSLDRSICVTSAQVIVAFSGSENSLER